MGVKELRTQYSMTRKEFSEFFGINYRTVQNWELGIRNCPAYVLDLMMYKLENEKSKGCE